MGWVDAVGKDECSGMGCRRMGGLRQDGWGEMERGVKWDGWDAVGQDECDEMR